MTARRPRWFALDIRGIYDPDDAIVYTMENTKRAAIRSVRDQGSGCVYGGYTQGRTGEIDRYHLVYWKDGDEEWRA